MYGKLINETLEYAPNVYLAEYSIEVEKEDEEGNIITETITENIEIVNFDKNIELMKKYGFKEVIDIQPEYDINTQIAIVVGYIENEYSITIEYEIKDKEKTIVERVCLLEGNSIDLIATTWAMDDRIFEIEWFLEDIAIPNTNKFKLEVANMAGLSKFEQARILILAGEYERESFERQLRKYESRNLITKDELDILISMMDARELVENN